MKRILYTSLIAAGLLTTTGLAFGNNIYPVVINFNNESNQTFTETAFDNNFSTIIQAPSDIAEQIQAQNSGIVVTGQEWLNANTSQPVIAYTDNAEDVLAFTTDTNTSDPENPEINFYAYLYNEDNKPLTLSISDTGCQPVSAPSSFEVITCHDIASLNENYSNYLIDLTITNNA